MPAYPRCRTSDVLNRTNWQRSCRLLLVGECSGSGVQCGTDRHPRACQAV